MIRFLLLGLLAAVVHGQGYQRTFFSTIVPLGGSGVTGTVVVFVAADDRVAYSGWARGLQPALGAANCTAVNGTSHHHGTR